MEPHYIHQKTDFAFWKMIPSESFLFQDPESSLSTLVMNILIESQRNPRKVTMLLGQFGLRTYPMTEVDQQRYMLVGRNSQCRPNIYERS